MPSLLLVLCFAPTPPWLARIDRDKHGGRVAPMSCEPKDPKEKNTATVGYGASGFLGRVTKLWDETAANEGLSKNQTTEP